MGWTDRLVRVDSMGASLGVYVPAVALQRMLNLARTVLFVWLLGQAQFGLWGLATMVFGLGSTLVSLGSLHGIARYVSHYQNRGELRAFYRAVMGRLTLLAGGLTAVGIALAPWLAEAAMGTRAGDSSVDAAERVAVFAAAMVNALLVAVYLSMVGWMRGLRVYRLLSAVDVFYGLSFLALGLGVLAWQPTAVAALVAHAVSLLASLGLGLAGLHAALRRLEPSPMAGPSAVLHRPLRRLLRFSSLAMAAALLWQAHGYASLWFVQRFHDEQAAGVFQAYFVVGQVIPILAATIWAVVYSHVSVHWEAGRQSLARQQLQTAYKAVSLLLTGLAVAMALTGDLWVVILPAGFRPALALVPWLLMSFLALANLGYAQVASNLRERPIVSVWMGLAALGANVALAAWLVPGGGRLDGVVGGAQAAGLGSLACLLVAGGYVWLGRFGAGGGVVALGFSPLLLLLPLPVAGILTACLLAAAVLAPWPLAPEERRQLVGLARQALGRLRRPRASDG